MIVGDCCPYDLVSFRCPDTSMITTVLLTRFNDRRCFKTLAGSSGSAATENAHDRLIKVANFMLVDLILASSLSKAPRNGRHLVCSITDIYICSYKEVVVTKLSSAASASQISTSPVANSHPVDRSPRIHQASRAIAGG